MTNHEIPATAHSCRRNFGMGSQERLRLSDAEEGGCCALQGRNVLRFSGPQIPDGDPHSPRLDAGEAGETKKPPELEARSGGQRSGHFDGGVEQRRSTAPTPTSSSPRSSWVEDSRA